MLIRFCTPTDLPKIIDIVNSYQYFYGMDAVQSGTRELHLRLLSTSFENDKKEIFGGFDDNGNLLGFCLQDFSFEGKWVIRHCYIASQKGVTQYNASKLGGKLLEAMCYNAELRNVFEFFYVVRDTSNKKRLGMTLDATDTVKEKYIIEDIEHIPAFTRSSNGKIGAAMLGRLNGKNEKPIIVRYGHLKKS